MSTPTQWNDPKSTWRMASYQKTERRVKSDDRRDEPRRSAIGDRRKASKRSLRSLLRF